MNACASRNKLVGNGRRYGCKDVDEMDSYSPGITGFGSDTVAHMLLEVVGCFFWRTFLNYRFNRVHSTDVLSGKLRNTPGRSEVCSQIDKVMNGALPLLTSPEERAMDP